MREILFRGKRTDNGKWVEGSFLDKNNIGIFYDDTNESNCTVHIFSVISETIEQYTGLTDKNGNKVFEGDILKNDCGMTTSVSFYRGRYYPFIAFPKFRCWDEEECEVIGNIHDNPKLLKGGEG